MKNLLIFIGPSENFDPEHESLTKIQIDNSLELGWKTEDIVLVTNFPYEYRGVRSHVIKGELNALDGNRSSKILAINRLFAEDTIGDDLYWFHDHDAFQLEPMRVPDLGDSVAGFTDNGWLRDWNAGSFFFTREAKEIFLKIYARMVKAGTNEQDALTYLWKSGLTGYKMLNITYNVGIYHLWQVLKMIEKPLIVAHFHPHKPRHLELFRDFLPERLLKIFKKHGIE